MMDVVYNKLLEQLAGMTPEQKAQEWEALKEFNDMGPDVESHIQFVESLVIRYASRNPHCVMKSVR